MTPAKPVLTPENKPQPKPTKDVKKKVPKKGKIKRLKKYIAEAQVGKVLTIIPKSQLIILALLVHLYSRSSLSSLGHQLLQR